MRDEWAVFVHRGKRATGERVGNTYLTPGDARRAAEHLQDARTKIEQLQEVHYTSRSIAPVKSSPFKRKNTISFGGNKGP